MKLYRHPADIPAADKGVSVALGNFDGLHRGHQVVIGEAGRVARERGLKLAVFTTEPHSRQFFKPDDPPFRLTPFRERAKLMEGFGVDVLACMPFDMALASLTPEDFVSTVLVNGLGARAVTVGYDYCFGKGRAGNAETLRALGERHGFTVQTIRAVESGVEGSAGEIYSSTLVRNALKNGEARRAAALLGHWWTVNGRVIGGDRIGRKLGFPTANVPFEEGTLLPRYGVYAVRVQIGEDHDGDSHIGVANIGARPTVGGSDPRVEVHLFDFAGDLYGKHLRIELVTFLRPEQKFDGLEALTAQIAKDCVTARHVLADPDNDRSHLGAPTLDRYLTLFPKPLFVEP